MSYLAWSMASPVFFPSCCFFLFAFIRFALCDACRRSSHTSTNKHILCICFPIYSWSRFALVFSSSVLYVRTTFFHVWLPTRYVLTLNVIFFLPRRIWPCLSYSARRRISIEKEVRDIRGMGGAQRNTDRGNNDFSGNRGCPRNAGSRRQTGWHFWLY